MRPRELIAMLAAAASCGSGAARTDAGGDASTDEAGDAVIAEYDLGGDFSIANNPNGPWRYGHTTGTALTVASFAVDGFAVDMPPIGFWHPSDADYYPYVAGNETQTTTADPTSSWAVRPREIAMEASADARYSVVQFVAPATATYDVQADFTGIHFRLSSTDVHVLQGDTSLFDAQIDGYGGDPAFHAVEGQSPQASYHAASVVAAGDVLSFAVGVGQDGTFVNDTTGLMVHVVARP